MMSHLQSTLRKSGNSVNCCRFWISRQAYSKCIKEAALQNPNFHLLIVCFGMKNFAKDGEADKWEESGITHNLVPDFVAEDGTVTQNVTIIFSKFKAFVENYPYNSSYEVDNPNNYEAIRP